jgi:hypothetical protein
MTLLFEYSKTYHFKTQSTFNQINLFFWSCIHNNHPLKNLKLSFRIRLSITIEAANDPELYFIKHLSFNYRFPCSEVIFYLNNSLFEAARVSSHKICIFRNICPCSNTQPANIKEHVLLLFSVFAITSRCLFDLGNKIANFIICVVFLDIIKNPSRLTNFIAPPMFRCWLKTKILLSF